MSNLLIQMQQMAKIIIKRQNEIFYHFVIYKMGAELIQEDSSFSEHHLLSHLLAKFSKLY